MLIIFIHGWSVTNTDTYGGLPAALAKNAPPGLGLNIHHLFLAKYVSFADEVSVEDIARGMENAIRAEIRPLLGKDERFACITHSTGGPVARKWIDLFYRGNIKKCPLSHLVMLAPANHGSALAQLGKGKLSRMKFFADDVQPGTGVLDWLELGSDQSWELNSEWLTYTCVADGLYPFVLTGQKIDRSFYDNLNAYTDEAGSDGVVRVAAANMNYGVIQLVQDGAVFKLNKDDRSPKTVLAVLPGRSHSGDKIGILKSVKADDDGSHPTVDWVLKCLVIGSQTAYNHLVAEASTLTAETQANEQKEVVKANFLFTRTFKTSVYSMLVFRVCDDRKNVLLDYDVTFTAGPDYNPNHLPPGFFVDRQRNLCNPGKLTYYVDFDVMKEWFQAPQLEDKMGFKIAARPSEGFAYYQAAEYQGTFSALKNYLEPNRTVMIDVILQRHVREGVFRLTIDHTPQEFKKQEKGLDLSL